jgi:hypothetical protein
MRAAWFGVGGLALGGLVGFAIRLDRWNAVAWR